MVGEVQIVASGEKWVGYGVRSFSSVVEELVNGAREELVMTVYIITDMNVVRNIERALKRGVSVEIFIHPDTAWQNRAVDEIVRLEGEYTYLRIFNVGDRFLHAKVIVADDRRVLAGSANPTFGGLVKNYELGFLVNDREISHSVSAILQRLKEI